MTEREPKCLFCGKPKSSGKRFIGGGGAIICDNEAGGQAPGAARCASSSPFLGARSAPRALPLPLLLF